VRRWIAASAGAVALVTGATVAIAQVGPAEPSAEALRAIATIAAPTVAGPLAGSVRVDETTYQIPGDCTTARNAYLAPGAPVPADAVVTQMGSTLSIDLPFARSGVVFTDVPSAGHCLYSIEQAPTLSITGNATALPIGDHFARVLCLEDDGLSVMAEVVSPFTGPSLVVVSPEGVAASAGSLADITALEAAQPLDATATINGDMSTFSATVTFGDGTTAQIDGRCTGSTFELLQTPPA
jgi:hypothetical protein